MIGKPEVKGGKFRDNCPRLLPQKTFSAVDLTQEGRCAIISLIA